MEKFLKKLTREAGKYLLGNFKKDKKLLGSRTTSKGAATRYDKDSDIFIAKAIEKRYPEHSILSEEGGFRKKKGDWLWIVDSLDGTGNFANSNPLFSVCIALMQKQKLVIGAVFAPAIDEFYFAKKGRGAFCNNKPIKVSKISKLKQSYVFYCEGCEENRKKIASVLKNIYPKVKDIRKIGCAGLETSWVASGRGDVYWTPKIDPWDIAPGVLLVEEAGGKATDLKGESWQLKRGTFLFTNGKLHNSAISAIQPS